MKAIISLTLACAACGSCWAQSGFSGSIDTTAGFTIRLESKFEPPNPALGKTFPFSSGFVGLGTATMVVKRYSKNPDTHEYFGYDIHAEIVDQRAGTYRLTFSALDLTPEELNVPDAANWRMLPAPIFPQPQVVGTSDTIAVDVFANPFSGQKLVDYIRISRKNCDALIGDSDQVPCLKSVLQDERQLLMARLAHVKGSSDAATLATIEQAQQAWEAYKAAACNGLPSEGKRLECEINLTRSRRHDL